MKQVLAFAGLLGLTVGVPESRLLGESWGKEFSYAELTSKDETSLKGLFEDWKTYFGRTYSDVTEESSRYLVFLDNLMKIGQFNDENTFALRLNQFGDLTGDEFKIAIHGHSGSCFDKTTNKHDIYTIGGNNDNDKNDTYNKNNSRKHITNDNFT